MDDLQGSSPSSTHETPAEQATSPASGLPAQVGPKAPAAALSCLGKAELHKKAAKRPCGGFYMRHSVTGQILPARCNSHLCPACSPLHQMVARRAFEIGIMSRWAERLSPCVVWLTLTDTGDGALDLPRLTKQWNSTRLWLQRKWGAGEYAMSREFQARGALHVHVAIEVADEVAADLVDPSTAASYRRRMHELRPMARRLGWGQMVDAVTIELGESAKIASYAAKSVAGYATKEAAERFRRAGAKKVRPVSLSYGWVPGGLEGTRRGVLNQPEMAESRLEGRWERIARPRTC